MSYSCGIGCDQQSYNESFLKGFEKSRNNKMREIGLIMNGAISGAKTYPSPHINILGYEKQCRWMCGNNEERKNEDMQDKIKVLMVCHGIICRNL